MCCRHIRAATSRDWSRNDGAGAAEAAPLLRPWGAWVPALAGACASPNPLRGCLPQGGQFARKLLDAAGMAEMDKPPPAVGVERHAGRQTVAQASEEAAAGAVPIGQQHDALPPFALGAGDDLVDEGLDAL